jgi:hypothetical protein
MTDNTNRASVAPTEEREEITPMRYVHERPQCQTCVFFRTNHNGYSGDGECCFEPPKMVIHEENHRPVTITFRPRTKYGDCCREWTGLKEQP